MVVHRDVTIQTAFADRSDGCRFFRILGSWKFLVMFYFCEIWKLWNLGIVKLPNCRFSAIRNLRLLEFCNSRVLEFSLCVSMIKNKFKYLVGCFVFICNWLDG